MLTEDDVVDAVCRPLEQRGYKIVQRCTTADHGEDIVAVHASSGTIRIEAKGETSNKPSSSRFGKPFSRAQVSDHVANAVYTALAMRDGHSGDRAGIALPDTGLHREYVNRVKGALQTLDVAVFWVDGGRAVRVEPHLP